MASPKVQDKVLIRTVTHYYTGEIRGIADGYIELGDAAWIADTGRFAGVFTAGPREVEPYPDTCWVAQSAIVDISPWSLPLPRTQK